MRMLRWVAAVALSGATCLASGGAVNAAPITALSAAAKPAATSANVVQVRFGGWHGGGFRVGGWGGGWHGGGWRGVGWRGVGWRGGGWRGGGWGWGVGALAAGALIGAAATAATTPYYWGDPYYYDEGPYPYGYAGVAYAPYYPPYRPFWRRSFGWYGGPWW